MRNRTTQVIHPKQSYSIAFPVGWLMICLGTNSFDSTVTLLIVYLLQERDSFLTNSDSCLSHCELRYAIKCAMLNVSRSYNGKSDLFE